MTRISLRSSKAHQFLLAADLLEASWILLDNGSGTCFQGVANEIGARIVAPIADRYYGLCDFTIADADGFGVRFVSEWKTGN